MSKISKKTSAEAKKALKEAVSNLGGQTATAKAINKRLGLKPPHHLKQGHIWSWLKKAKMGVAPDYCSVLSELSGISKESLRPDIFRGTNA